MNRSTFSRRGGLALALVGASALCAGHIACSREPTAVIVAVTTDMVVDGDLDELGLYVGVAGEIKTSLRTPTSADQPAKLPGTLSILQPSDESTPVHVRVAGYKKGELKVVRDAITTVPSGQLSLLRVPLSWLASTHKAGGSALTLANTGSNVKIRDAVPGDNSFSEFAQFFPGYVSPCAQGQTSNDGECVDATAQVTKISSGDLVREVYGGALGVDQNGVAEGGTCFDIDSCFANEQTLRALDYQDCKVKIPAGLSATKTVNFAIVRNDASGCTSGPNNKSCFVPLDWDGKYDEASSTFTFAPQVCKRIGAANTSIASTRISVATNCDAKTASRPRCNGLFGAVRDKAPSDPTRVPYYSDAPPNPTDGAPPVPPDAGRDATVDAADAAPPGPQLLATLTDVKRPRKLGVANDRVWVRGSIGLAFLDARGLSIPTQFAPLPPVAAIQADDGTQQVDLVVRGNEACTATLGTNATAWCYNLTTLGITARRAISALFVAGSDFVGAENFGQFSRLSVSNSDEAQFSSLTSFSISGVHQIPAGRAVIAAFNATASGIALSNGPPTISNTNPSTPLAEFPAPYRSYAGRVSCTTNTTEAFCVVCDPGSSTGAIARKVLLEAFSIATFATTSNVPFTTGDIAAALAADDNYVYWGGGAAGPMAISTCTARTPTAKALFPSTGGQDNTTYAVARAGSKVFFATNDGRVYAMDPPAPEPCP